jgi:hypothetical protein
MKKLCCDGKIINGLITEVKSSIQVTGEFIIFLTGTFTSNNNNILQFLIACAAGLVEK